MSELLSTFKVLLIFAVITLAFISVNTTISSGWNRLILLFIIVIILIILIGSFLKNMQARHTRCFIYSTVFISLLIMLSIIYCKNEEYKEIT